MRTVTFRLETGSEGRPADVAILVDGLVTVGLDGAGADRTGADVGRADHRQSFRPGRMALMATRGFENFTATDAARHALKHTRRPIAGPTARSGRRSKYGAVKVTIDGITFDSKREAARYGELKALEQAGEISRLCCQPSYPLEVVWFGFGLKPDKSTVIGIYRADFAYFDRRSNCEVVEDVKGMKTPVYRLKKKHVEAQYGIQIREIR